MSRIAITGIGVVAPGATGVDAFRALLNRGETAIREVDRFDTAGLSAHKAALVRNFNPKEFLAPMKMRRMNMLSRFGVSAAKLALTDRGGDALGSDTGVAIGTTFGPMQTSVDYMQEYVEKGAALAPPQLFAESVANAPGSHIAIENGLRGFNVTVTQRESSALGAAMYASSQVIKGNVRAALAGGVEEVNEMIFSVLDRIGALAHANGAVDEQGRPFDRHRNGITIGEGAAVFTLEGKPEKQPYASSQVIKGNVRAALAGGVEEVNEMIFSVLDRIGALAHANGAVDEQGRPFDRHRNGITIGEGAAVFTLEGKPEKQPYAYISGFGIARDATATISDWGTGHDAVVTAMRGAIGDAGIEPSMIDAIHASGNGSRRADRLEYRAIQSLFADRIPPVVATKGYFGEYAGGGSLHFAAAVLAVGDQTLHESAGFESGDEDMRVEVNRRHRPAALEHVLVNSISAGGGIVSMVLSRQSA